MRIGVAALLVVGVVGVVVLSGCQAAGGEAFQYSFNQALVLDDRTVGQSFRPATERIAGVDLLVATFDQPVDPAGTLRAVLHDGPDGPVLARATLEGTDLANNEWAPVRFVPAVPAPQVAAVKLSWDGASPLAIWGNVPAAQEPADTALMNDPYPGGQLLRDGERAVGDLAFRVVGSGDATDAARNVAGILRQGAGRLAARPLFLGLWVLALAGAGGLGVYGLRRPAGELDDGGGDQQRRRHDEARP